MASINWSDPLGTLRNFGLETDTQCASSQFCITIAQQALFVIGLIGGLGLFAGASLGWTAIGLGGGVLLFTAFTGGKCKERLFLHIPSVLLTLTLVSLGVMGCQGILSGSQLGWGMFASSLIAGCICGHGISCRILNSPNGRIVQQSIANWVGLIVA